MDKDSVAQIQAVILSTMVTHPDCIGAVAADLHSDDFVAGTEARAVYDAITKLYLEKSPVNFVTVAQVAGPELGDYIDKWLQYPVSPEGLDWYSQQLRDTARLMSMQAEALHMTMTTSLEEAGQSLDQLNGMMVSRSKVDVLSAAEAAQQFYDRQSAEAKPEYFTWGLEDLNRCLFVQTGDFVVVGGYPSAGKTLLSIQFAVELAAKYSVGYFSLETSCAKLIDRTMSHMGQVPLSRIKNRKLTDEDWASMGEASTKLAALKLDFIDAAGMSVSDVRAMALNRRYQVVFVDYLQLLSDGGSGHNRYEQVTNISQGLHTMARSCDIAVVALAQLSRPEKNNGKPQPPNMSSFRESGQIEQDADAAILLWPEDPNDNTSNRILKLAKNKEGDRCRLTLAFDGARQTLTLAEPSSSEKYQKLQREIKQAGKLANGQVTLEELKGEDPELPF